ncbi:MAG: hypothetical protein A2068_06625 [Ignavibacteria bacterium GWB2_35_6b]|nr:MAG: hypothetical protein A2068_06625 [Ignavibacteria bacterium GWB2_35_6b]
MSKLLEMTLKYNRDKFCPLVLAIVEKTMAYSNRGNTLTKEEIEDLNKLILKLNFKIPELWSNKFLDLLPSTKKEKAEEVKLDLSVHKNILYELTKLNPNERGFAFEKFLNNLFDATKLTPRNSFRIVGEQIDGSFQLDSSTYLLEAKWQSEPIRESELLVFHGKVSGKATWSRGLFLCYNTFSSESLIAFSKGKTTNIIGMTSQDLFFVLEENISLPDAIRYKTRWAAETGEFYKSIYELINIY